MEVSPNARWDKCLALIRDNVSEQQYKTWFEPIVFEAFNEQEKTVLIQVPSPFVYEYLEENYVDLLRKVLRRCFDENVRLSYRIKVVEDKGRKGTSVVEGSGHRPQDFPRRSLRSICWSLVFRILSQRGQLGKP